MMGCICVFIGHTTTVYHQTIAELGIPLSRSMAASKILTLNGSKCSLSVDSMNLGRVYMNPVSGVKRRARILMFWRTILPYLDPGKLSEL